MRFGVSDYNSVFSDRFIRNLKRYAGLRKQIKRRVDQVISNPYVTSETLGDVSGKLNLRGCRSVRVDRNFRIIFVLCEECRRIPECGYCYCDDLPDKTIVFLTVGPHDRAYAIH